MGSYCSWCWKTELLPLDSEPSAPLKSSHVPEPLCQTCFDEITRILEKRLEEVESACLRNPSQQHSTPQLVCGDIQGRSQPLELVILGKLHEVENSYWKAYNALHIHLLSTADKRDSLQKKMEHAEENLGNLRAVALGYFDIGLATTATIGTINSYRLGTLSQEPVEWWEINTAWGVAVLLLDRLRIEVLAPLHAKHKKHFWIDDVGSVSWEPRGSYPRVTVVPTSTMTPTIHELVGPVSKIICPGYDKALVLFVKSLNAVGNALGNADEHAALPYPIEGDRVGGLSVRYGFSRDVTWTSALRHVLANLEWCLSRLRMKC